MRIAFITNLSAHYNIGTFELLAKHYDVDYFFFSDGNEWYWPKQHHLTSGNFHFENLRGFRVGSTRITPSLATKLLRRSYDVYIKCINGRFALPVTYLVARLKRKPFILWTGIWSRIETPIQKIFFPLTQYIYRHSDAIVVYGEHVKQYLIREGVSPERIFVAAHSVDNNFYGRNILVSDKDKLRMDLGIEKDKKVILYLGRLEESKGIRYLLQAFSQLDRSNAVLLIAGAGSQRSELEEMAQRLGIIENTRFVGYISIELAPLYYSLAWVYVLPSITVPTGREPWGLVVNEAMNQGIPVIATDAVGAAVGGLVQDGINGFVVPERDDKALASRLQDLLESSSLHQELSQNARHIVTSWNYEANISGYRSAIEYVLKKK